MTGVDCPACADERAAGAAYCEACGRPLREPVPAMVGVADAALTGQPAAAATAGSAMPGGTTCRHCGALDAVGDDGYCAQCGMLAGRPRDHLEIDLGAAGAAVTDRGRRHHRNEDAAWLAGTDAGVDAVVCDGVSASYDPDVASAVAAETAGALLATAGPDGVGAAVTAAARAVAALADTGDPRRLASNPACTIVAACVRGTDIAYSWIGDSRAYWLPADGPAEQLTVDDSWATHAIAMGADPAAAMAGPQAHAITAWLGADSPETEPHTGRYAANTAGHLVLCSDGLWNYLTDPAEFADTVREHLAASGGNPLDAARTLTAYANARGGADNITVTLVPAGPPASS